MFCFSLFFLFVVFGFFSYGSTIVAKILELGFYFFGRGGGLVLVVTLQYEYYVV